MTSGGNTSQSVDYTLVFESPPGREGGSLRANLDDLVATPGVWARVAAYATANSAKVVASCMRRGVPSNKTKSATLTAPAGQWEFATGLIDDGRTGVWALYIGPEEKGCPTSVLS
jgi:hypothetical protein